MESGGPGLLKFRPTLPVPDLVLLFPMLSRSVRNLLHALAG